MAPRRSAILPGYPVAPPLSAEAIGRYYDGDRITCLLCGRAMRSVGHHLPRAHGMTPAEYQDRYGLPRTRGLVAAGTREAFSASIRRTIDDGGLDAHYRSNADRATAAAHSAARAKRDIRRHGLRSLVAPGTPRDVLERAIALMEAGSLAAAAVRQVGLSWSGFHAAMKRHADLHARYLRLPIRKGRRQR